jgi:two-component system response regulator DevR
MAGMTKAMTVRVVLVEDHPIMRAGVRDVLSRAADIEIVGEAETGAEAAILVRRMKPDVVLLDIGLPDIDGLSVLPLIKAAAARTRVIMYSCICDEPSVCMALEGGASGYLVKSAKPQELIDAVRNVAAGHTPLSAEASTRLVSAMCADSVGGPRDITPRERDVWKALADGMSNAQIASALFISEHTVKFHIHNLLRKLGLRSRSEAICAAHRREAAKRPDRSVG